MGMGGAFTAIADDAFAAYWNPAGFAINPGIDVAGSYQLTNRNNQIGDNTAALKTCFEVPMNPFAWAIGIGAASLLALEGAKYLSDNGTVHKNWGSQAANVPVINKEDSAAEQVKAEDEKRKAEGLEPEREPISLKQKAKEGAKQIGTGTIYVADKLADAAILGASQQNHDYYYAPGWYQPSYYHPNYWDNRYQYQEKELTPAGKAQFAMGLTWMSDQNSILDQNTNWYTLSLASGWGEIAAIGGSLNVYDLVIPSSPGLRGLGAGLDVGGLLRFSDKLMFGLALKEVLTTDIKFSNNTVFRYPMSVNGGVAIKPLKEITLAADIENLFGQNGKQPLMHYGVELKPIYGVALRAGLSDTDQVRQNKTAGFSIGVGQAIIDYAYLGGAYGRTQTVALTWKL